MTEKSSKTNKKQPSFEESLDELDMIIHKMESRDLGLTESLAAYEKGVSLLRQLHEELSDIEQRVVTLVRIDEDGTPVFETAASTAESEAVSRRTSARVRGGDGAECPGLTQRQVHALHAPTLVHRRPGEGQHPETAAGRRLGGL